MRLRDRVLMFDNYKGVRVYAFPTTRLTITDLSQQAVTIEVKTLCQMTFANNSRQGKALAMAEQNGLLH